MREYDKGRWSSDEDDPPERLSVQEQRCDGDNDEFLKEERLVGGEEQWRWREKEDHGHSCG